MSTAFPHCNWCHPLTTANSVCLLLQYIIICVHAPLPSHPFCLLPLPFLSLLLPPTLLFPPFPFLQTSQPSVKKILFHSPVREEPYIARLNTMAAVFLLLQVQAELNEEICDFAFDLGRKLVEQYFNDKLQVISLFHTCKMCTWKRNCAHKVKPHAQWLHLCFPSYVEG